MFRAAPDAEVVPVIAIGADVDLMRCRRHRAAALVDGASTSIPKLARMSMPNGHTQDLAQWPRWCAAKACCSSIARKVRARLHFPNADMLRGQRTQVWRADWDWRIAGAGFRLLDPSAGMNAAIGKAPKICPARWAWRRRWKLAGWTVGAPPKSSGSTSRMALSRRRRGDRTGPQCSHIFAVCSPHHQRPSPPHPPRRDGLCRIGRERVFFGHAQEKPGARCLWRAR